MYNNIMRMTLLLQLLLFCNILYGQQLCIFDGDDIIQGSYDAITVNEQPLLYRNEKSESKWNAIHPLREKDIWAISAINESLDISLYFCADTDQHWTDHAPQECTFWHRGSVKEVTTTSTPLECGEIYQDDFENVPDLLTLTLSSLYSNVVITTNFPSTASLKVTGLAGTWDPDKGQYTFPSSVEKGSYTLEISEVTGQVFMEVKCSAEPLIKIETGSCELCVFNITQDVNGVNGDYVHTVNKSRYKKIDNGCNEEEIDIFPLIVTGGTTLRKWLIGTTNVAYYVCNDDAMETPQECTGWTEVHSLQCGGKVEGDFQAFQISIDSLHKYIEITNTITSTITSVRAFDSAAGTALTITSDTNTFTLKDKDPGNYIFVITNSASFEIGIKCYDLDDTSSKQENTVAPESNVDAESISSKEYNIAIQSGDCVSNEIEINECEEDTLHPVLIIIIVAINVIVVIIAIIIIITICLRRQKAATAIKEKDDEQESMLTEEQVKKRLDLLDLDKFEDQHAERLEAKRLKSVAILGSNIDVDIDVNDSDAPKM